MSIVPLGALADPPRGGVAVHRPPGEGAEDQDVERALHQVHRLFRGTVVPLTKYGKS